MRCAKLVVPETGFVGEEKFCLSSDGGGLKLGPNQPKSSPEVRLTKNWVPTNQNRRPGLIGQDVKKSLTGGGWQTWVTYTRLPGYPGV